MTDIPFVCPPNAVCERPPKGIASYDLRLGFTAVMLARRRVS